MNLVRSCMDHVAPIPGRMVSRRQRAGVEHRRLVITALDRPEANLTLGKLKVASNAATSRLLNAAMNASRQPMAASIEA